ncbi:flagellar protein FlaG [Brassicibacter mesophilus]|uniref:flagellar protein FlaG n=1 Tax=Brassicibacter mesophilus TaxID=745119 RepID=UPI003D1F45EC
MVRVEGVTSSQLVYGSQRLTGEDKPVKVVSKNRTVNVPSHIGNESFNKRVSEEELIHAIESANKSVNVYDRKLEFSIHDKTKEIMVKVIDTNTDEVIREIPPEKILDMVAKLWEMAGIIVDKKI